MTSLEATAAHPDPSSSSEAKFGRVILQISNSVLPLDKLSPTPSAQDGMSLETEADLRNLGCNLIQTSGKLLKLPQVAMATGCVLFQRFFFSKSFVRYSMEVVAMGCVCLACKIEEAPRRVRDVINVFAHIKQVRQGKPIKPVVLDAEYIALKNNVIKAERRVLKELGFCVHIKHPHKLIVMYLQLLGFEKHEKFMQMSWNFMNDSLRTDGFVRYQPETIACACIYLSARKLGIPLPKKPAWYDVLGVEEDDIRDCCYRIICLYQRSKPVQDDLEKEVENLKNAIDNKRKADRGLNNISSVNSPASLHSSPKHAEENGTNSEKETNKNGKEQLGLNRSRSLSHERKKRKKHKRSRSRSGSDRENRKTDRKKGKKHDRSPDVHSPSYNKKGNRHRSRSRSRDRFGGGEKDKRGDRYGDRYPDKHSEKGDKYGDKYTDKRDKGEKYEHRTVYQDKYKKGSQPYERDYYNRR